MNGTFTNFPRNSFNRPLSTKRTPTPTPTRLDTQAMLRDMAYVLQITRSLKESILAGQSA